MGMKTTSVTRHATEVFIDDLLKQVHDFAGFLGSEDISRLYAAVRDGIADEISWHEAAAAREQAMRAEIPLQTDTSILRTIHERLNELEMERFLKTYSVPGLHKSCTEYRDLLAGHGVRITCEEMSATDKGGPPVPFALISTGSDGREEQTLITDQDYLIVYGDEGGKAADDWFADFSTLLVERLAEMGFKKCTGDMMPSNPTWRGSLSQWKRRLQAIVRYEFADYAKNLMDLIVLSDARYVAGDERLAATLIDTIRGLEQDYFQVLWGMAKAATEMRLALGFLKRLWTEGSGEHKGEFNIKLLAWAPLVMNVRILAINHGIPATSTLKRIHLLQNEKSFSPAMADGLSDAYHVLTRHRILLQIKVIKGIQNDSYYLNPYELPSDEREKIRQAILRIEELQKMIHINFHVM